MDAPTPERWTLDGGDAAVATLLIVPLLPITAGPVKAETHAAPVAASAPAPAASQ